MMIYSTAVIVIIGSLFALGLLIDKFIQLILRRKYTREIQRAYYRGVHDTNEQRQEEMDKLTTRVWKLEAQVRHLRPQSTNGARR